MARDAIFEKKIIVLPKHSFVKSESKFYDKYRHSSNSSLVKERTVATHGFSSK